MYSELPSSDDLDHMKHDVSVPVSAGRYTMLSQRPMLGSGTKTNEDDVSYENH